MCSLIQETFGHSDIPSLAKNYTTDSLTLVNMLDEMYDYVSGKTLKARITRMKKRLINSPDTTTDEESTNEN